MRLAGSLAGSPPPWIKPRAAGAHQTCRWRNPQPDPWVSARVKDLDMVLAEDPLNRTALLTRTTDMSSFGITSGEDFAKLVGAVRTEPGYISTSRIPGGGTTKKYTDPVRVKVIAPSGTPAAAIEDLSMVPRQGEILLDRGREYVITSAAYDDSIGMWRVTIEIG